MNLYDVIGEIHAREGGELPPFYHLAYNKIPPYKPRGIAIHVDGTRAAAEAIKRHLHLPVRAHAVRLTKTGYAVEYYCYDPHMGVPVYPGPNYIYPGHVSLIAAPGDGWEADKELADDIRNNRLQTTPLSEIFRVTRKGDVRIRKPSKRWRDE